MLIGTGATLGVQIHPQVGNFSVSYLNECTVHSYETRIFTESGMINLMNFCMYCESKFFVYMKKKNEKNVDIV